MSSKMPASPERLDMYAITNSAICVSNSDGLGGMAFALGWVEGQMAEGKAAHVG